MSGLQTLNGQIKNPRSKVFRKLYIKRRQQGTGVYESDWQDISDDVIKWGNIRKEVDSTRANTFKFSNITLVLNNDLGKYNPSSDENSLWFGYGDQQRTLIKVLAGFLYEVEGSDGVWAQVPIPHSAEWDVSYWDNAANWDSESVLYSGYISGDINLIGNNQINIPVVPLTECFRQFSASRLTGYDNSLTASDFMYLLRDQQDTLGNYIFRPFFGDTTGNWDITATSVEYANLNTAAAADLTNLTVWDVVTKLSEAENYIPYVTTDGKFKFIPRDTTTTTVFDFYGPGRFSSEYGRTIKKINWYGKRFSKYYSRVTVKHNAADTSTSYETVDSQYLVSGDSGPWTLGERTLQVDNTWIPTSTVAETIATELFNEYSAIKTEIDFSTSFVPHLDVLDRVLITYDQTPVTNHSLWDVYNWCGSSAGAASPDELVWDDSGGDAIKLEAEEFKLISIDINLDNCECKFIGRK
jgi:hypothetical protein